MPTMTIYRADMAGEDWEFELTLSGNYVKGYPAIGPRYDHGGIPGEPDTFEDISAIDEESGIDFADALTDDEYERAIDLLVDEHDEYEGPDPDDAYDRMREDD